MKDGYDVSSQKLLEIRMPDIHNYCVTKKSYLIFIVYLQYTNGQDYFDTQ